MAITLPPFNHYQHVRRLDRARHGAGVIPHAVYVLFDADEATRKDIIKTLNHNPDVPEDDSEIVKEEYLGNSTLEAAFERHGKAISDESISEPGRLPYQYERFVCVNDADWKKKGVLLVSLVDEGEEQPVAFHCNPSDVAAALQNLSIANMDWEDFAEDPSVNLDLEQEAE